MELTYLYRLMLYGGITGALITLSIAIWLFFRLDIRHVIEDLTGIRLGKSKRKQSNTSFEMWNERDHTSSKIELKKIEYTSDRLRQSRHSHTSSSFSPTNKKLRNKEESFVKSVNNTTSTNKHNVDQTELSQEETFDETELLKDATDHFQTELLHEQDDNQTELLEETSLLGSETELISDEEQSFLVEEEVIVTHNSLNKKEGLK
ncbi:hypothetical protein ACTNEO_04815 [Gracilibacillus sp. HCP3S3_G5_1]|uniref:hypothetical protein n=1 Tax=unclassified Gracilibacillus TaxID=2625209 RepID=UPI003F8A99D2